MERPFDNQVVMNSSSLDGVGFGQPATVVIDDGRFIMYYHMEAHGILGRAESIDGLHWENRSQLNMSRIRYGSDFCVLLDRQETDSRFRWKMIARCKSGFDVTCLFSSADGLNWNAHGGGKAIYGNFTDTLACLHRDTPGKDYQLILRYERRNPKLDGRGIRGTVVVNGTLEKVLESVKSRVQWKPNKLSNFLFDAEFGDAEMFRRQLYSLGRTHFLGTGYMGIGQTYEYVEKSDERSDYESSLKRAEELGLGQDFDSLRLHLMPSRDGLHFDPSWVYAGVRLLPEDLTEGYHLLSEASELVTHQGYHWLYYERDPVRHFDRWQSRRVTAQIALARFHEGRLARLRPVQETGVVVTEAFDFDPCQRLSLDLLSPSPSSSVAVELLRAGAGSSAAFAGGLEVLEEPAIVHSEPVQSANGSTAVVEWIGSQTSGAALASLRGQEVRLRLTLSGAVHLYGLRFDTTC